MLSALFSLMYYGLLRVSEVARTDGTSDHNLTFSQLSLSKSNPPHLTISFHSFKHSLPNPTPMQVASLSPPICPVHLYSKYLTHRGKRPGKAFCFKDMHQITRDYVSKSLRAILALTPYNSPRYNTHSFRIGRATDMAAAGASDRQIMLAGRWKTLAFLKYIRPPTIHL